MEFLKTIAGKVMTGVIALAVVAGGISWYAMEPTTRSHLLGGIGKIGGWIGVVLFFPWAGFLLINWVSRLQSNRAAAIFILVLTLMEVGLLLRLFNGSVHGATAWTAVALGGLFAGAYNLFTCDWIAEKMQ